MGINHISGLFGINYNLFIHKHNLVVLQKFGTEYIGL